MGETGGGAVAKGERGEDTVAAADASFSEIVGCRLSSMAVAIARVLSFISP